MSAIATLVPLALMVHDFYIELEKSNEVCFVVLYRLFPTLTSQSCDKETINFIFGGHVQTILSSEIFHFLF